MIMAYVRFSLIDSDVHVAYTIHGYQCRVATCRMPEAESFVAQFDLAAPEYISREVAMRIDSMRQYEYEAAEALGFEQFPIGGEFDGTEHFFQTATETISFLRQLESAGYRVPHRAFCALSEECNYG